MDTCHCCGYKTIDQSGNYEICEICFWEDDAVQSADPWCADGANKVSLFQAQLNFKNFGAKEKRLASYTRSPGSADVKDRQWRRLSEADKDFSTTPAEIEKVWGTDNAISYNYWERLVTASPPSPPTA